MLDPITISVHPVFGQAPGMKLSSRNRLPAD
jgi:hypothetical protein